MSVSRFRYFCSFLLEHDLSLTSITPDLRWPMTWNFVCMCQIDTRKGTENVVFLLFKRNHRGGGGANCPPPPNGARVNPCRAGGLDFPWSAGGAFLRPPSNSAPELRSDIRQAAFESLSKISKKVLQSFLRSGQWSGHQRSLNSKCSRFSIISTTLNFRRFSSWTRRARAARKKSKR